MRSGGGRNAATPVIAVTGAAEHDSVRACRDAGMDAVVAKPVTAGELVAAVAACLDLGDDAATRRAA